MRIVAALGGNALLRRGERPDAAVQRRQVALVAPALAAVALRHELVIVHGNGPQVGMLALETGSDPSLAAPYPLSDLVAETQGLIGLWLQQGLANAGVRQVVSLVSQTVVDPQDPGFAEPTKFIGPVYGENTAAELAERHGWTIRRDGALWRRVVASPLPRTVIEVDSAELLLRHGVTVVLGGGGGVPVVLRGKTLESVDAVVDKDHVGALVAESLDADLFLVLTDVPAVMLDFGTPQQRAVGRVAAADLLEHSFPAGSMGPKVEACCRFARITGRRAAIGALEAVQELVEGSAGTQITATGLPVGEPAAPAGR